ncbi:hypothetical protein GE061_010724 [Apolygus lucorum]|uniref:PHD-type domain-containing protein n=1 Tax=Apolygus lucorum TaxID=248454 RepID=A0A8S9XVE7_APOLU|nr:hypothetical protein GE061_010724 [Apolygus lucorum]
MVMEDRIVSSVDDFIDNMDESVQEARNVYTETFDFVKRETTDYSKFFDSSDHATNSIMQELQNDVQHPRGPQDLAVEEVDEEITCPFCLVVVKDNDQAVQCDGICDKWYHIHCVEVGVEEYQSLSKTDVPWICPYCPENDVRSKPEKIIMKKEEVDDLPSSPMSKHEEYYPSSCDDFEMSCSDGESTSDIVVTTVPVNVRSLPTKYSDKRDVNRMVVTRISRERKGLHKKKLQYKCDECDSSYTTLQYLNRHKRTIHLREKPFKCELCAYATSNKDHLKIHMMRHKDERPFQCKECNSKFYRKGDLKVHLRVHTGEKPYNCGQCDFSSSRRGNLMYHLKQHSGDKLKCSDVTFMGIQDYLWNNLRILPDTSVLSQLIQEINLPSILLSTNTISRYGHLPVIDSLHLQAYEITLASRPVDSVYINGCNISKEPDGETPQLELITAAPSGGLESDCTTEAEMVIIEARMSVPIEPLQDSSSIPDIVVPLISSITPEDQHVGSSSPTPTSKEEPQPKISQPGVTLQDHETSQRLRNWERFVTLGRINELLELLDIPLCYSEELVALLHITPAGQGCSNGACGPDCNVDRNCRHDGTDVRRNASHNVDRDFRHDGMDVRRNPSHNVGNRIAPHNVGDHRNDASRNVGRNFRHDGTDVRRNASHNVDRNFRHDGMDVRRNASHNVDRDFRHDGMDVRRNPYHNVDYGIASHNVGNGLAFPDVSDNRNVAFHNADRNFHHNGTDDPCNTDHDVGDNRNVASHNGGRNDHNGRPNHGDTIAHNDSDHHATGRRGTHADGTLSCGI